MRSMWKRRERALIACLALLAAACSRQAVVGSPGTPGAGGSVEATLRTDLRSLHAAEERYFATNGRYTNQLDQLDFAASPGVDVSIIQGDRRGYSAIASADGRECAVFGGEARPPRGYVSQPGRVGCRP